MSIFFSLNFMFEPMSHYSISFFFVQFLVLNRVKVRVNDMQILLEYPTSEGRGIMLLIKIKT